MNKYLPIILPMALIVNFPFSANATLDPSTLPYIQSLPGNRFRHEPYGMAKELTPQITQSAASRASSEVSIPPSTVEQDDNTVTAPSTHVSSVSQELSAEELAYHEQVTQQLDTLGKQSASAKTVQDYQVLIVELAENLQQRALPNHVRFNTMNNLAYAHLGLSNVFGKMRDNASKYSSAEIAFLLYVTLTSTSFVSPFPDDTANHKAGTCFLAMNDAIYYMRSTTSYSEFRERLCSSLAAYVPDEQKRSLLQSRLGVKLSGSPKYRDSIASIIARTSFIHRRFM